MTLRDHKVYTDLALRTLLAQSTHQGPHQLCIVDDGSEEPYVPPKEVLDTGPTVIRNCTPNGYVTACNQILDEAQRHGYDIVVLVNNDVIFTHGWDSGMVRVLEENPDAAVVGPMTNRPGHQPLQQVSSDKISEFIGDSRKHSQSTMAEPVPFVNGFCMMLYMPRIPKWPRFRLKGRDKNFGSEDHLCGAVYENDMRCYVAHSSWVYHFKAVTTEILDVVRTVDLENLPRLREDNVEAPAAG